MSVIVFGENRRQKPVELLCPGGKIVISREPHGTVRLKITADAGEIELSPGDMKAYSAVVTLLHEERES